MKILQINSHYNQGGAARIVACIHKQLLEAGVESHVAYGRGAQPAEVNVYRIDRVPEVYLSALVSRVIGINGWMNRGATKRLLRLLQEIKPDMVHLHALHGYYLNLPLLFDYLNAHQIPCVWTFHDCHAFVGNCGYFFDCRRWEGGCEHCPYVQNYPKSQFFDFTRFMWKRKKELFTQGKKIVVTPSEWLTAEAQKSFMGKYPCITIRNGIDTEGTFYPRDRAACREKYGYVLEEKLILGIAVGYSDPRKGAKYIIQMAKDLEGEAKVILIGWEKENDATLAGTGNIQTLPVTMNLEVLAEYYSMADVFVLPSLAENYATVSLEAMACGTPVVGFDAGGIPEQLTGGKGLAVETGNQEAFTEAVRKVLRGEADLITREELAEIVGRENSTQRMVEAYLEIYGQLAGMGDTSEDIGMHGNL